jgi:iron complex transport system substrate-binding protein
MRYVAVKFAFGLLTIFPLSVATYAAGDVRAVNTTAQVDTSRIVSIGGSVTEILYALGQQQKILAVDTTSLYPESALKEKPNVGYMRQLSPEGVLALSPTLILALEGSGPKETIDVLQRANVPFVIVPDKFNAEGILEKIAAIAADVEVPERGKCLAHKVKSDLSALGSLRQRIHHRVKVAFLLSLANGRPMMSGHDTAADGIIAMAGAENAFDDFEGYKPVNDEAITAARPDAILVMRRGEHALSADQVFSLPAFAATPAAVHKNLIAMDGLYLLGFGPRTARAARDLAGQLYPDVTGAGLPSEQSSGGQPCDR